jgi:hypothetical protein
MKHTMKKQNYIQMEFPHWDELVQSANPPKLPPYPLRPLARPLMYLAMMPLVDAKTVVEAHEE